MQHTEQYVPISHLNDFIFCPKSIYFHRVYQEFDDRIYKDTPQQLGTQAHESVDNKTYSTRRTILQGTMIYSTKYGICGKIDLYDQQTKKLWERKRTIKRVYDGYKYQLWAQYLCMHEMGYDVQSLMLYSMTDNRSYDIPLPTTTDCHQLKRLIKQYRSFNQYDAQRPFTQNPRKCAKCIYRHLCDTYTDDA